MYSGKFNKEKEIDCLEEQFEEDSDRSEWDGKDLNGGPQDS